VRALRQRPEKAEVLICATGQHRQMLDQVLAAFEIRPDLDLALMTPGQTLARLSADAMVRLDEAYSRLVPDIVLVQGDTTTAMVAGLAAFLQENTGRPRRGGAAHRRSVPAVSRGDQPARPDLRRAVELRAHPARGTGPARRGSARIHHPRDRQTPSSTRCSTSSRAPRPREIPCPTPGPAAGSSS
jgi:hypothetical protein